jgi:hypothetical protein
MRAGREAKFNEVDAGDEPRRVDGRRPFCQGVRRYEPRLHHSRPIKTEGISDSDCYGHRGTSALNFHERGIGVPGRISMF